VAASGRRRWRSPGIGALLVLALMACGAAGGSSSSSSSEGTARPRQDSFARFDFKGGTVFPPRARLRIGDVAVPPGAREAFVPITLDRPTPNTVHARVLTRNGTFPDPALEGRHFDRVDTVVVFRPGDPLTRTVRVPLRGLPAGTSFALHLPQGADGAVVADGEGTIRAASGAQAGRAVESGFRSPRRFVPQGTPAFSLAPLTASWSDPGGPGVWSTRLPHGRTQPANGETGLYLDPARHTAPEPPIAVEAGALVLRSQQLARPISYEGKAWNHGAAVLSAKQMPEAHLVYGQIEWEAQMPDRRGSWPALWLLPTSGWPPEIDVYEGFGEAKDWNFSRHISVNLHGGAKGRRSFTAPLRIDAERFYGLSGFASGYHRFAVDIAPGWITWFVDGMEVYQAINPFPGTTWFPLMTVAVKHPGKGSFSGGSGAMRVRSMRVWRSVPLQGAP
jgi:hypothetical protein